MSEDRNIAVVGDFHLAYVTTGALLSLGHRVLFCNPTGQAELSRCPVREPGVDDLLAQGLQKGTLEYRGEGNHDWKADVVWLSVDSPINDRDEVDVEPLWNLLRSFKHHDNVGRLLIISSQVPLGFCDQVRSEMGFSVVYVPENLRLGRGLETFLQADRMIVGSAQGADEAIVSEILEEIPAQFMYCDLMTAEMVKHATNAFLATSISFANELARIGRSYGVDSEFVGKALKADQRIGKGAYVLPGLGFAGGTLPRDLRVLQKLAHRKGLPSSLVDAVLEINEGIFPMIVVDLQRYLGSVDSRNILLMGYSYKAETDALRRSPAFDLAKLLLASNARVRGMDPLWPNGSEEISRVGITHFPSLDSLPESPDAVVLMVGRTDFQNLPWKELASEKVGKPLFLIDTQGSLIQTVGAERMRGLHYRTLWQPESDHGLSGHTEEVRQWN